MALPTYRRVLRRHANAATARDMARFFQADSTGYGAGDKFHGVKVPTLRRVAKQFPAPSDSDLEALLTSPYHEERFLGALLLIEKHRKAPRAVQARIARYYLRVRRYMNNWDLVDLSAPALLGPHLDELGDAFLLRLAKGRSVWDRRIAMLATFHEIRNRRFRRALRVANALRKDENDLVQKAVGWMLREIGERDPKPLRAFLDQHAARLPRTMLRYAIEKRPAPERKRYLAARADRSTRGRSSLS